jgi:hypothetical protein
MLALTHELLAVGRFPDVNSMERCLDLLTIRRTRIPKPGYSYNETILLPCVIHRSMCSKKNCQNENSAGKLRHYNPIRASLAVTSNYQEIERDTYLRAVALDLCFR